MFDHSILFHIFFTVFFNHFSVYITEVMSNKLTFEVVLVGHSDGARRQLTIPRTAASAKLCSLVSALFGVEISEVRASPMEWRAGLYHAGRQAQARQSRRLVLCEDSARRCNSAVVVHRHNHHTHLPCHVTYTTAIHRLRLQS